MATREREPVSGRGANVTPAPQNSSALVNLKEVEQLIDLIIEKGVSEFELERNGVRIKIARNSGVSAAVASAVELISPAAAASSRPLSGAAVTELTTAPRGESASVGELYVVRSPMVGTFYACASQGAAPFVRVGDRVQAGQVLCIIEAMKLMNEIEAETAGEVVNCYVENGQPVEYGEALFDIRPVKGNREQGSGVRGQGTGNRE